MEAQSAGRRARARAIGWLIAGGAAMVLIWVALPHPERAHDAYLVALVVATWIVAAVLLAGRLDAAPRRVAAGLVATRRAADLRRAARDRRPRERLRAVLRLPRPVRLRDRAHARRGRARRAGRAALRGRTDRAGLRRPGGRGRRRARRPLDRGHLRQRRARAVRAPSRRPAEGERGPLPARLRRLADRHGDHHGRLALARGQRRALHDARAQARASSSAGRRPR